MIPYSNSKDMYLGTTSVKDLRQGTASVSEDSQLYVSTSGNDTNPGTKSLPFLTINKAKVAVAALIVAGLTGNIAVYLRGGTYRLTSTEVFTPTDTDSNYRVTYKSYPGETAIINGMKDVSGAWVSEGGGIYSRDLTAYSLTDFRSLIVAGLPADRARYPSKGSYHLAVKYSEAVVYDYMILDPAPAEPVAAAGENLEYTFYAGFVTIRHKLLSISTDGGTGERRAYAVENAINDMSVHSGYGRYYWQGSKSFLTDPGEFYFHDANKTLYYYPRAGETADANLLVEVPVLETLVSGVGIASHFDHYKSDFSVSLWFRTSYTGTPNTYWQKPLVSTTAYGDNGFQVQLRQQTLDAAYRNGFIFVLYNTGGGGAVYGIGKTGLNDGKWHHVVAGYDVINSLVRIYVDGVEVTYSSGGNTIGAAVTDTVPPQIGWSGGSTVWDGDMHDIVILNTAVKTAADATKLMNQDYSTFTANLKLHMEMKDDFDIQCDTIQGAQWNVMWKLAAPTDDNRYTPTLITDQSGHDPHVNFGYLDRITMKDMPGEYVENLHFQDLTFTGTDWPALSDHLYFGDAIAPEMNGAVQFLYSQDCSVNDCEIKNAGSMGIFGQQCRRMNARNNKVHDCGYEGITFQGNLNSVVSEMLWGNIRILDNEIYEIGRVHASSKAIHIYKHRDCKILRNYIHDTTRMGIAVYAALDGLFRDLGGHEIAYNRIRNTAEETVDCGGIYANGFQLGTTIHHNHIKDILDTALLGYVRTDLTAPIGTSSGIYLDESASQIEVYDNLVYRTRNNGLMFHQVGPNCTVRNNIFVDMELLDGACFRQLIQGQDAYGIGNTAEIYFVGNVTYNNIYSPKAGFRAYAPWTNKTTYIADAGGVIGDHDRNLFAEDAVGTIQERVVNTYTDRDLTWLRSTYNLEVNSTVGDPLFTDAANDDYTVLPGSPALALGFKNFTVPDF